jgi:hypothetical protein
MNEEQKPMTEIQTDHDRGRHNADRRAHAAYCERCRDEGGL